MSLYQETPKGASPSKRSSCDGKVPHGTRSEAVQAIVRLREKRKLEAKGLIVYKCVYCPAFHVGHMIRRR